MIERRDFLKTLGLTGSAMALERCTQPPTESLMPYVTSPDNTTPGVPSYYATTCRECPAGCGMVATVIDGRVVKAEGNPNHPVSRGHLCARGQAAVQSLYSPDRFGMPRHRAEGGLQRIGWDDAEILLAAHLHDAASRGRDRIAWIGGLATGSFEQLTTTWLNAFGSQRRIAYEPFDYEPLRAAGQLLFDRREVPAYHFDRAEYIVGFGAEFLDGWLSSVEFTGAYAALRRRRIRDADGTFTWIAPRLSLTGVNSDAWVPVRPGAEAIAALSIANALIDGGLAHASATPHLGWLTTALSPFAADRVRSMTDVEPEAIRAIARRFSSAKPSLAVGGGVSGAGERHAIDLELAVLLLNVLAGNIGDTVTYGAKNSVDALATRADIDALTRAMSAGTIDVLLIHDCNPVFTLPASVGFTDALRHVPFVVSFANTEHETTEHAHLVLPDHHFLESWGDYEPRAGITSLIQPAAGARQHSRATGDVLLSVARRMKINALAPYPTWREYVTQMWRAAATTSADEFDEAVRAGGRFDSATATDVTIKNVSETVARISRDVPTHDDAYTFIAYPSSQFYDGRGANAPWLREVPDPVTKIVWNGWVEIHPDRARSLGVHDGDTIEVTSVHGRIEATCRLSSGIRPDVIAAPIGFGRTGALRYASGRGSNVLTLLPPHAADGTHGSWQAESVRVRRLQPHRLVIALQAAAPSEAPGERIAQLCDPQHVDRAHGEAPTQSLYPAHTHPVHRWGMAIDLNSCTGCNACVVACYAENNVPVVGEQACADGREMSWIRIDRDQRIVTSTHGVRRVENVFLPMLCQQCDDAPCESVCPVYATYHNPEGLNAQVYARCIGTRFCSNNCPYKVRRFNWSTAVWPSPLAEQLNPSVTVRSAGVMEKCTFCIQRINAGKQTAKREQRSLRDGDITPACSQTCPADAIVFGDLHDPDSRVSKLSSEPRGYHALEHLNTRPAITYLRRSVPGAADGDS